MFSLMRCFSLFCFSDAGAAADYARVCAAKDMMQALRASSALYAAVRRFKAATRAACLRRCSQRSARRVAGMPARKSACARFRCAAVFSRYAAQAAPPYAPEWQRVMRAAPCQRV